MDGNEKVNMEEVALEKRRMAVNNVRPRTVVMDSTKYCTKGK